MEHLQSLQLNSATMDILAGEVQKAMVDLPYKNIIGFFTDGPNAIESLRGKMKGAYPDNIDIGECCLHRVYDSFARGMSSDVEAAVVDIHHFFYEFICTA